MIYYTWSVVYFTHVTIFIWKNVHGCKDELASVILLFPKFRLQLMVNCSICGISAAESDGRCVNCRSNQRLHWELSNLPQGLRDWALPRVREWTCIVQEEKFKFVVAEEEHRKAAEAAASKAKPPTPPPSVEGEVPPKAREEETPRKGVGSPGRKKVEVKEETEESPPRAAGSRAAPVGEEKSEHRGEERKEKKPKDKEKKRKQESREKREEKKEKKLRSSRTRESADTREGKKERKRSRDSSEEKAKPARREASKSEEESEEIEVEESAEEEESHRRENTRRPREPSRPPRHWRKSPRRDQYRGDPRGAIGSQHFEPYRHKKWTNKGKTKADKQRKFNEYYNEPHRYYRWSEDLPQRQKGKQRLHHEPRVLQRRTPLLRGEHCQQEECCAGRPRDRGADQRKRAKKSCWETLRREVRWRRTFYLWELWWKAHPSS